MNHFDDELRGRFAIKLYPNPLTDDPNDLAGHVTSLGASDFEISAALSSATINAGSTGNTATVSVRPKTGLAAGTYTGTPDITGDNGLSFTAGLSFTVNAAAYGTTVGSFTGGSVSTNKTLATAGETVTLTVYPASGYELSAIRVHKTGDASVSVSVTVSLNGFNGLNGIFTMPAFRLWDYLACLFLGKGWDITVQKLAVINFFPTTAGTITATALAASIKKSLYI